MKNILIALLILTVSGCASSVKKAEWQEEVANCERGWGNAVIVSLKHPKFLRCMSNEELERTHERRMACLEAGNLPRHRGEVIGYGPIMDSCQAPDTSTKVRLYFHDLD